MSRRAGGAGGEPAQARTDPQTESRRTPDKTEWPARVDGHGARTAIRDDDGDHSYDELSAAAATIAASLSEHEVRRGDRVGIAVEPSARYVHAMLGAWKAAASAVPIGLALAGPEVEHVLDDAEPKVVIVDGANADRIAASVGHRPTALVRVDELTVAALAPLRAVVGTDAAVLIYTSGTTGRPKGVVHTHASIAAQIEAMVEMWSWSEDDHILCTLPLHHVHGIVNVVCTALWCGARCDVMATFDAVEVWRRFASGDVTLFMAVPTLYLRLIQAYDATDPEEQAEWSEAAHRLRLMVSGSAALPVPTLERWRSITGHTLLERYGMSEIGMALSNRLDDRRPGHVGVAMPGVDVRLVDDDGVLVGDGAPGEIQVRGPNVFSAYWNLPEATRDSFDGDWFRTGDIAVVEDGSYRILGRASTDIIKSGGEKVSALEVEDVLRAHPAIVDSAVVGVPDEEWGERVCAAVVTHDDVDPGDLRTWAKARLAGYKAPRQFLVVDELPRNAMGKVTKPELSRRFT